MSRHLAITPPVNRRQRPARRRARSSAPIDWRGFLWPAVMTLVGVAVALVLVWSSGKSLSLGYELSQQLGRQQNLRETRGELKLRLFELTHPGRLEAEAKRLGLKLPASDQVRRVVVPENAP
ncbi:hypothetical protein K8I61_17825 [bacterium]|nr:hypothetical protein [bacterium]